MALQMAKQLKYVLLSDGWFSTAYTDLRQSPFFSYGQQFVCNSLWRVEFSACSGVRHHFVANPAELAQ
jgi:hypothetical protein